MGAPISGYDLAPLVYESERVRRGGKKQRSRPRSRAGVGDGHPVLLLEALEQNVFAALIPGKGVFYAVQLVRVVLMEGGVGE